MDPRDSCPHCAATFVTVMGRDAVCEDCGLLRCIGPNLLPRDEQERMIGEGWFWIRGVGWENGRSDAHTRRVTDRWGRATAQETR